MEITTDRTTAPWKEIPAPVGFTLEIIRNVARGIPKIEFEFEENSVSSFPVPRTLYSFGTIISHDFTWILQNEPSKNTAFETIFDLYREAEPEEPADIKSSFRCRFKTWEAQLWEMEIYPVIFGGSWSDYFDMDYTAQLASNKFGEDPPLSIVPFFVYMSNRALITDHVFYERIS